MAKRILDGMLAGVGIVIVVGAAFAIAYAGDIFTVDKDGTLKFAVNDQGKITVGATESYVNLVIQNDGTTPNSKVNVTADVLTVEGIRLESVNVSADITASGAGGLDTGSEAANTWYYVWAISNNTGSSTNGLLSTSSTAPTLPSGFTKKRRVGAVRNNGSSDFLQFVQEGNICHYLEQQGILAVGRATVKTTIGTGGTMPPTSRRGIFRTVFVGTHNVANTVFVVFIERPDQDSGQRQYRSDGSSASANIEFRFTGNGEVETDASQQIKYLLNLAPSNVATGVYIYVAGYYDRI